jgi:hypothetical protein
MRKLIIGLVIVTTAAALLILFLNTGYETNKGVHACKYSTNINDQFCRD